MAFKITRTAHASWSGTLTEGGGRIGVGSGVYEGPFTLRARTEEGQRSTNPEELVGAAHAGCFTMSLANELNEAGHPPDDLQTTAHVVLEQTGTGFSITRIELVTRGRIAGVDAATFARLAEQAKATCPVSRALAATQITLDAQLVGD